MKRNHLLISITYIVYIFGFLVMGSNITSCKLPEGLSGTDTLTTPNNFMHVPDSTQAKVDVPVWRNFFQDSLLVALIDTAISNNIDIKMATQRIFKSQAGFNFSKKAFYPNLNAKGAMAARQHGDYTENGVGNYDLNLSPNITEAQKIPTPVVPDAFIGLETSWEIGFAGKLRNRKKAAYYNYLSSQNGRQFVQTQLVANVARLYYELLSIDNELEIIRRNLDLQSKSLEILAIQKKSGQINELAVKQFNVQLLHTRSLEAEKMLQAITVENSLNVLVGRYPQPIQRSDSILTEKQLIMVNTGLPDQLLQNRPDIMEAEKQLKANEKQLKAVRAAFFPGLNISAYIALNGFNAAYFFNPASAAFMVAGSLTAPLLNRNKLKRDYWLQASEKKQAFLNYQKIVLTGVSEVSSYYNRMLGFQRITELKKGEVSELKMAVDISNDLFVTGYANYLEVLTVRRNVLDAEIQLTEARKEFFQAYIELYKAMGGGWQ